MIQPYAEAIAGLPIADKDLAALRNIVLNAAYEHRTLDSQALITICEDQGSGALAARLIDANGLAFSFTRRQSEAELARRDLGMAIEVLSARPELDAATARLAEHWDDTRFAEQMRLQQARREADAKLASLAERAGDGD